MVVCLFFLIFKKKKTCTLYHSVTALDIFMKLKSKVYQVKIMCCVQSLFLSLSECWSFDCFLSIFCIIYILVHATTHSEFSQDHVWSTIMNVHSF